MKRKVPLFKVKKLDHGNDLSRGYHVLTNQMLPSGVVQRVLVWVKSRR